MRHARYASVVALLVLLVAGAAGADAQPDQPRSATEAVPGFDAATATPTPNGTDAASLLSREELYATAVDADRHDTEAALFYIDAGGSWYDTASNGTVGSPNPGASSAQHIEPGRLTITADERPLYVWRVTAPCGTTVYDASSGRIVVTLPIPGCGAPSFDSEVPTPTSTSTPVGRAPGFGAGGAMLAVVLPALLMRRR